MTLKEFIAALEYSDSPTPVAERFDGERDANGVRKYGQKSARWWDALDSRAEYSSQRYHVLGHFLCWYHQGAPSRCSKPNGCCRDCYENTLQKIDLNTEPDRSGGKKVSELFGSMNRPEMFLYIAEALRVLPDDQLQRYVEETKKAIDKKHEWKNVRKEFLSWEMVENRVNDILNARKAE